MGARPTMLKTLKFPNGRKKEIQLPTVPKSLKEFRDQFVKAECLKKEKLDNPSFYPCMAEHCQGKGVHYDPFDAPDPVEGNKMRRKIGCKSCHGTGFGSKLEFNQYYKKEKHKIQENQKNKIQDIKETQNALDKLSANELSLILEYYH